MERMSFGNESPMAMGGSRVYDATGRISEQNVGVGFAKAEPTCGQDKIASGGWMTTIPKVAIGVGSIATLRAYMASGRAPLLNGVVTAEPLMELTLEGVQVLGAVADIEALLEGPAYRGRDCVVLVLDPPEAIDLPVGRLLRLNRSGRRVLRQPMSDELIDVGAVAMRATADALSLKALLGRDDVRLECLDRSGLTAGERVLVTGAGGSIGSEICVMLARLGCAHLTLLDSSEHNLFTIERRVAAVNPDLSVKTALCDVRDRKHLSMVIAREKPTLVFHTAALKHVPMVEMHPSQGVLTNLIGTRNVADACTLHGVRAMTFVSTDKAVQPSSVMGLTKRLAEDYVRARGREARVGQLGTRFVTVRFGNVLGTSGSVAPIFAAQIEAGGPVTITHPDMERYFMSPEEAVRLTLRATALDLEEGGGDDGLYVLEMGDPIRILEFARRMIEAYGMKVGRDIALTVVGPRPGEKISEALIDDDEIGAASGVPGLLKVVSRAQALAPDVLSRLETAAREHDDATVLRLLADIRARRSASAVA